MPNEPHCSDPESDYEDYTGSEELDSEIIESTKIMISEKSENISLLINNINKYYIIENLHFQDVFQKNIIDIQVLDLLCNKYLKRDAHKICSQVHYDMIKLIGFNYFVLNEITEKETKDLYENILDKLISITQLEFAFVQINN